MLRINLLNLLKGLGPLENCREVAQIAERPAGFYLGLFSSKKSLYRHLSTGSEKRSNAQKLSEPITVQTVQERGKLHTT